MPENSCVTVFTSKSLETTLKYGGTFGWELNQKRVEKCLYCVCVQNCHHEKDVWNSDGEKKPHRTAFLIGKISGVVPSPDGGKGRVLIKFSEYAEIDSPNVKGSFVNPINYLHSLSDFGINNPDDLKWKKMPKVSNNSLNEKNVGENHFGHEKSDAPLNQIFYGPPGTGKTYKTVSEAVRICAPDIFEEYKNDRTALKKQYDELVQKGQVSFVTFHQSYGYEEFIEGLKATTKDGNISYDVADGIFKQICSDAKEFRDLPYVLIIDEINRGNISKIFGELITLIEDSKREGNTEALSLKLPYSGEVFSVPNNVYLIGTMNTADRSLALIDTALRRRFEFVEMMPDASLLETVEGIDLKSLLKMMNDRIELLYDREHMIGHSFLLGVKTIEDLKKAFQNRILPLLQEYFFEDWEKINLVLGKNGFIEEKKPDLATLFERHNQNFPETIYTLAEKSLDIWNQAEAYKKIIPLGRNDATQG